MYTYTIYYLVAVANGMTYLKYEADYHKLCANSVELYINGKLFGEFFTGPNFIAWDRTRNESPATDA